MKEEIFKLVTLHGFDRKIHEILGHLEERHRTIAQDEARLATATQQLDGKSRELKAKQLDSQRVDNEIKALEHRYKEMSYQLLSMKDQRTYDAMKNQLQTIRETIAGLENDGMALLTAIDELQKTVGDYAARIEKERARVAIIKQEHDVEVARHQPEVEELKGKRSSYESAVRREVLAAYQRLLKLPDKKPLAELDGRTCTGCYSIVTLDTVERVKMQQELVLCNSCGRILFMASLISAPQD